MKIDIKVASRSENASHVTRNYETSYSICFLKQRKTILTAF